MRIVIPGGTGRLGLLLARHFHEQGHAVATITRFPKPRPWEAVHWDAETLDNWVASLESADAVINLAGPRTTQLIASAISQCASPPAVWLDTAIAATASATRQLLLCIAPVMTPESGAFTTLLRMVRCGFGGNIGSGEQYLHWIHDFDFIRAIEFLIQQDDLHGALDITSPVPITCRQFMCNLRRAWCTSYLGLPSPPWLITRLHPELCLTTKPMRPQSLINAGFSFHFPEWRGACENLVLRWRQLHDV